MLRSVVLLGALFALAASTTSEPGQQQQSSQIPARRGLKSLGRRWLEAEELSPEQLEEEAESEEPMFKWTCVVAILSLAATFAVGHTLEHHHVKRLPEAGVGVLMGALAAGAAKLLGNEVMLGQERFDFEFFMVFLLPPIIFEAGFNMNVHAFIDNLGPTMFFAFVGTFGSTFVVGGIVWFAGQLGLCYPLGLLSALTFGSLISATDPVTVLAVFQALGVKVDLFSMVFGESVLNDAVAIVLSTTLLSFTDKEVNADSIMGAVALFCTIFIGSLVVGLLYGLLSAWVFKKLNLRHHHDSLFVEAVLSFTFPWASYYTSEAMHFSGIVTILFCGMVMATYTRHNFSEEAVKLTAQAYKCVALLAETYVLVYLGMSVFTFPIFDHTVWLLALVAMLACFVGRAHIYIGSWIFNCQRTTAQPGEEQVGQPKISPTYMFVMWFSGLRGGVAFALASVSYASKDFPATCGGLPEAERAAKASCSNSPMTDSLAMLQVTLIIAAFTIFVFGGAITEVAIAYDVLEKKGKKKVTPPTTGSAEPSAWERFNDGVLLPFLTFPEETKKVESAPRFEYSMVHEPVQGEQGSAWSKARAVAAAMHISKGPTTREVKGALNPEELEVALKGVVPVNELTLEDKLDELRKGLPSFSSFTLKKLLNENDNNVELALMKGQSQGF